MELCGERRGNGVLGGGFAGRAGDGDNAPAPLAAHMRGQRLQGEERIFGDQQRAGERGIGQGGGTGARDHGSDGSALEGCGNKIMTVEALAANRKEQLAGRDGARVDGVAGGHERAGVGNEAGASSTAPAPIAASASVRFIAPHDSSEWWVVCGGKCAPASSDSLLPL